MQCLMTYSCEIDRQARDVGRVCLRCHARTVLEDSSRTRRLLLLLIGTDLILLTDFEVEAGVVGGRHGRVDGRRRWDGSETMTPKFK